MTPVSAGRLAQGAPGLRPCTPLGVIELLDSTRSPSRARKRSSWGDRTSSASPSRHCCSRATRPSRCDRDALARPPYARAPTCSWRPWAARDDRAEFVKPGAAVVDVGISRMEDGLKGTSSSTPAERVGVADHAGSGRGGADDDRDAVPQYGQCRVARPRVTAGETLVPASAQASPDQWRRVEEGARRSIANQ